REPRFPAGAPDRRSGAVEPVPALRPQPAKLRAEHLLRTAGRLPEGDAERVPGGRHGERGAASDRALGRDFLDLALHVLGRRFADWAIERFNEAEQTEQEEPTGDQSADRRGPPVERLVEI